MPNTLESIGSSALPDLTSLNIPANVSQIDNNGAYFGGENLTVLTVDSQNPYYTSVDNVIFSKDMTKLIAYASGKSNTSYNIPYGVTEICQGSFDYCINLTNINIPDSVKTMGNQVFMHCPNIEKIFLPSSVEEFGGNPFMDLDLKEIEVSTNNKAFCTIDGVLYSKNGQELVYYPQRLNEGGSYQIPEGTKEIRYHAFSGTRLYEITMPDSIDFIDISSFENARIEKINLSGNIKTISEFAFSGSKIKSVEIPDGLLEIESYAFEDCRNLEKVIIPKSVNKIGDWAFYSSDGSVLPLLVLYVYRNSYAATYAENNGIPYVYLDDNGIFLDKTDISLEVGNNTLLFAKIYENGVELTDIANITWSSSNDTIATVMGDNDTNGAVITGYKEGTATITATLPNGASASCLVNVVNKELKVLSTNINNDYKGDKVAVSLDGEVLDYVIEFNTPIKILDDSKILVCKKADVQENSSAIDALRTEKNCYIDEEDNTKLHIKYNYRNCERIAEKDDPLYGVALFKYGYSIPLNKELCVLIDSSAISAVDESYSFNGILKPIYVFKTTSGIEFFTDTYNFEHTSNAFFNKNEEEHYILSQKAADLLVENGASSKEVDNSRYVKDWNGSCAGLSIVNMLMKYGIYSPSDFQNDADTAFDLKAPKINAYDGGFRDTVNYYQLYHNFLADRNINFRRYIYNGDNDIPTIGWNCDYQSVLQELVQRYKDVNINIDFPTMKDTIIPFGYRSNKKICGHVIIPYDLKEESEQYVLFCYDVNQASLPLKLYISKDFENISFSNEHYNDWVYIGYTNMSEYMQFSPFKTKSIAYNSDSVTNNNTVIKISSNNEFVINNGEKSFTYSNGKFSGDVELIKALDMTDSIDGCAADIILELDSGSNYTVTSLTDTLDFQYENNEMFMYINSVGAKSIDLNYDTKNIEISGKDISYTMSVSSDLTNDSLLAITGKADSSINVKYDNNDAVVKADNTDTVNAELIVDGAISETKEFDRDSNIYVKDNTFEKDDKSTESTTITSTTEITTERQTETSTQMSVGTTEANIETTTSKPNYSSPSGGGGGGGGGSYKKAVTTTESTTEITTVEKSTESTTEEKAITNEVRVTIGSNLVTVGNKTYAMDVTPYIQPESSSTLVPLRFAAIAISGGDVENADSSSIIGWDANTKTATITVRGKVIKFIAGSELMYIENAPIIMENGVKAEIQNGRMFIPFRALGKALGVKVDWDSDTKTAIYSVE